MIEEVATIVRTDGTYAWVSASGNGGCRSCEHSPACGTGVLGRLMGRRQALIRLENSLHADSGEQVVVGIDEWQLLRGAALMYLVPLLGLFCGAAIGLGLGEHWFGHPQPLSIAGGLIGLIAVFRYLRGFDRRPAGALHGRPVMLRRSATAR